MDVEQLKQDIPARRITLDRLIDVIVTSQRELQAAKQELEQAKQRIADLERRRGGSATQQVSQPFSLRAEERRQETRGKKRRKRRLRRGRMATAEKIAQAVRTEKVFPAGVPKADCWLSRHTAGVAAGERPSGAGRL